jgi:uncharacterized protein YndB with AHSA1/START domain
MDSGKDEAVPPSASQVSRTIKASRAAVYRACLDPDALAAWRAPDAMAGRMHDFDGRVGGGYRMSLTYRDTNHPLAGKSSEDTDTFRGRFIQLVPGKKMVEVVEFESPDPRFAGVMTITTTLADAPGGTQISMSFEGLPAGISPKDNDEGARQSLNKLAAMLETQA